MAKPCCFNVFFNTSEKNATSSKWILGEDATLRITYKLPFDAKTGTQWTGELQGEKILKDVLLEDATLSNSVYFNYTEDISSTASSSYEYSPKLIKDSVGYKDGIIDYKVIFRNSVPGTNGTEGYLNYNTTVAYFTDTFDEKLEYVENSLTVTCYSPWEEGAWLNKYTYKGSILGNTIKVSADQFLYAGTNSEASGYEGNGLENFADLETYYKGMDSGGDYIFTYKLQVKDEYLYSTDYSKYGFDNLAE